MCGASSGSRRRDGSCSDGRSRTAPRFDTWAYQGRISWTCVTSMLACVNPIPGRFELPRERVEEAIDRALADARAQGVMGKDVTPFLLARVNASTGGDSLEANVALVPNNATVAARISRAYAEL